MRPVILDHLLLVEMSGDRGDWQYEPTAAQP
jgi:hypothetical protein